MGLILSFDGIPFFEMVVSSLLQFVNAEDPSETNQFFPRAMSCSTLEFGLIQLLQFANFPHVLHSVKAKAAGSIGNAAFSCYDDSFLG